MNCHREISALLGLTLTEIQNMTKGTELIVFITADGRRFEMLHVQDCCERVYLEDVNGEVEWLLNSPILIAEEATNKDNPPADHDEEYLWTFYRLGTEKGTVVLRWYGESNGYYSVDAELQEVTHES